MEIRNHRLQVSQPPPHWRILPPWPEVLEKDAAEWARARAAAKGGPKILITNAFGIDPSPADLECLLAVALTLRGADVHFMYCDRSLPACWVSQVQRVTPAEFVKSGPPASMCDECFPGVDWLFKSVGLPVHRHGELVTPDQVRRAQEVSDKADLSDVVNYRFEGLAVGEHALAGALRFYARGDLDEPLGDAVLRRFLKAAIETVYATRRIMDEFPFDCVVTSHGMYVPEGLICEVARERKARVVACSFGYRKKTVVFSHQVTYHHTLLAEPVEAWENLPWTQQMEDEIMEYLYSRRYGTRDWVTFIENPREDIDAIERELGVDFSKPCIALLTNVVWDAQLYYPSNAFSNMMEWVSETIRYFERRPDLQLIIRVHPGELMVDTRARQTVTAEIEKSFPKLPRNVVVIPPESPIGTYTISENSNAVVVYGTKAGVELASFGIPVIVAGEAFVRNKGITLDASNRKEYFDHLARLPLAGRSTAALVQRARKYAYHFFFRIMIPLPFAGNYTPKSDLERLDDIRPGRHVGLDVACDGILNGSEFAYPAERWAMPKEDPAPAADKVSSARTRFRTADGLGELGETERMRAHLLKAIQEFPSAMEDPWVRGVVATNMVRMALSRPQPIDTVHGFWRDSHGAAGMERRLVGEVLREVAVVLWKRGAYVTSACAAAFGILYHPRQLFQKAMLTRLLRAYRRKGEQAENAA